MKLFVLPKDSYPAPVSLPQVSSPAVGTPDDLAELTSSSIAQLRKRTRRNLKLDEDSSSPSNEKTANQQPAHSSKTTRKSASTSPPKPTEQRSEQPPELTSEPLLEEWPDQGADRPRARKNRQKNRDEKSTSQKKNDTDPDSSSDRRSTSSLNSGSQQFRPQQSRSKQSSSQPVTRRPTADPQPPPRSISRNQISIPAVAKKPVWKRFEFIVGMVGLLLVITVSIVIQQMLRAQAVESLRVNLPQANELISAQDWAAAAAPVKASSEAFGQLGTRSEEARTILQYDRELTAIHNLSLISMEGLLTSMKSEMAARPEGKRRGQNLGLANAGQWLILEATVVNTGKSSWSGRTYQIELDALAGEELQQINIQANFPIFDRWVPPDSDRVTVFAGQFRSAEYNEEEKVWTIELNRKTVFLWGHQATLEAAGLSAADPESLAALQNRLQEQFELQQ